MFTKRIIPCLDVHGGRVVKGVNFVNLKDAGDPVEIAKAYDKAGAISLAFLDITASSDARNTVVQPCATCCRAGCLFHLQWAAVYGPLMILGQYSEKVRIRFRSIRQPLMTRP